MRFISADRVFNGSEFLQKDSVIVLDEKDHFYEISAISKIDPLNIERFNGIITPGFINAHCHLELSHLNQAIPKKTGLVEFAKNIILKRGAYSPQEIITAMEEADGFMKQAGIVAVGDICNTNLSFKTKQKSKLRYHSFIELIGLDPKKSESVFASGLILLNELHGLDLKGSFAAHAPYSTSTALIEMIITYNQQHHYPFSIHNQESEEENKFLQGKTSEFNTLFEFLKMDISWFKPNFSSSLNAYAALLKGKKNILVHNTFTSENDLISIGQNAYWCLCPSANLYIEGTLPNYVQLIKHTQQICFGTDSLASNSDLDILKEASLFYSKTKKLDLCLKALTSNGAKALGLQNEFGTFIAGKNTGLNLIEIDEDKLTLKKIIS